MSCRLVWLPLVFLALGCTAATHSSAPVTPETPAPATPAATQESGPPWEIPILVVRYYPVKGDRIDIGVTHDWGESLDFTRAKCDHILRTVMATLEEGSRYHAYQDPTAKPSLKYRVVGDIEYLDPLPVKQDPYESNKFITDYAKIMERIGVRDWVEGKGVKEIWIFGYDGGVQRLWESNMASPYGDVSNSDRNPDDLPVLKTTYTVYHYNYQRGPSEATEDHIHQIEATLNGIDGRDETPGEKWGDLLFWGKFVGSDATGKIVRPGCGWAHYPPNAERDYDWANPRFVESDIENWKPDGSGKKSPVSSDRWGRSSIRWFIYWMQNIPGAKNGLTYQGKPLRNWWIFFGDYDHAKKENMKLWEEK